MRDSMIEVTKARTPIMWAGQSKNSTKKAGTSFLPPTFLLFHLYDTPSWGCQPGKSSVCSLLASCSLPPQIVAGKEPTSGRLFGSMFP